jgi:hypothetical protein
MEEVSNLTQEDVNEIIQGFNLQPRMRDVIITVNTVQDEEDGIILSDNSFSDVQYVIATGSHVLDLKPGQKVILNLESMMSKSFHSENTYENQTQIKIFPVVYRDRMFALVSDNVIKIIDNNK